MSHRFVLMAAAAATAVGCAAPAVDDVADASGSMTEAVVVVEQRGTAETGPQTTLSAKFMRLSSPVDPSLAERVVGSKLDLPAAGVCRGEEPTDTADLQARSTRGGIELVDVGDLTLRPKVDAARDTSSGNAGSNAAGAVNVGVVNAGVPLAVRAFPEVGDLVSGLFYTSPDTGTGLAAGSMYTLEGTGAGSVERFTVDLEAPPSLEDVRLGGVLLSNGAGDGVALDRAKSAPLRWTAASTTAPTTAGSTADGDVVYVDVAPASGASVRCTFKDSGAAELPAWVVSRMAPGAVVTVHRVRERSFVSVGLDVGEIRFDVAVSGRAALAPEAARRALNN